MTRVFRLLTTVFLLLGPQDEQSAAMKEYARFEGVWRFALVEVEGARQAEAPFETNKIIIRKGGSYVVVQGQRITRGRFKVDPTKSPKHFDATITEGPAKGHTFSAIYELDGDTYKFCASLRSKDRPSAFSSEPESGTMLQVLKREKQTVKEALMELGRQELTGTWQAVASVADGKKATDEDIRRVRLSIDAAGKTTFLRQDKPVATATTKIDPTLHPMTVDLTWIEGDSNGTNTLGIYKLEDDHLTICHAEPAKARPKEFSSKPGSGHRLVTYKRIKALEPRATGRKLRAQEQLGREVSLHAIGKDGDDVSVGRKALRGHQRGPVVEARAGPHGEPVADQTPGDIERLVVGHVELDERLTAETGIDGRQALSHTRDPAAE